MFKLSIRLIIAIILLFSFSYSIEVKTLDDSTLDKEVGMARGSNWLLLFYLETCPHCKNAKEVLNRISDRKEFEGEESLVNNLQIGQIECSQNNWSCMRFNITRVPTVVMLQNDQMFDFDQYITEDKLFKFITEEKLISSGQEIPAILNWYNIFGRVYEEVISVLNEQIRDIFKNKLGLNFEWNTYHTILLLLNSLFLLIGVEYLIVSYCCGPKKAKVETKQTENLIPEDSSNVVKDKKE